MYENGYSYEAIQVAEKVQMACFHLQESENETNVAKIYCDLSILYAKDTYNISNVHYAKSLLMKALNLAQYSSLPSLKICIYQNLSAVNNRIGEYESSLYCLKEAYNLIGNGKQI
jgi:lipopolysaccharide biosynthesis regulator YciM